MSTFAKHAPVLLSLIACGGQTSISNPPAPDGAAPADAAHAADSGPVVAFDAGAVDAPFDATSPPGDGSLATFCTGATSRMVVNGVASQPAASGAAGALNCCDEAAINVVTQTFAGTISVVWRAQAGSPPLIPATIDLANPPMGWSVAVDVNCDPVTTACLPAPDSFVSGLTGTLQVLRSGAAGYAMTLCLEVAESPGAPHPIVHSLELYAPNVTTM